MFADEEKDNVEESKGQSNDSPEEKDLGSTGDVPDEGSEQTVLMEDRQEIKQVLDGAKDPASGGDDGDWESVEPPKADSSDDGEWKDAGASTPAALETPKTSDAGTAQEPAKKEKVVSSAPPVPPSEQAKSGGIGGFLANLGIEDEDTQKWVLIGGGVLIFLCCACSCVVVTVSLFAGNANF